MYFLKTPKIEHVCAVCGKRFHGRPDARTCSNKCRQQAYRNRLERPASSLQKISEKRPSEVVLIRA